MGFCFCSDLLFIGGGDREPQSFQSPGAPPAKNGSQSSSARCVGVLPYSSSTATQSMATAEPSANRASTRLVSILKQQESSLFMVNLISISNGVTVCKQCGVCKGMFCDDTIKITVLRTFEI